MKYSDLKATFAVLERIGFALQEPASEPPFGYLGEHHKVRTDLLDHHSRVACSVALLALPQAWVDGFSIIAWYDRSALESLLVRPSALSDEEIAEFIARNLTGVSASVFERVTPEAWMELHKFHLQSQRKRNKAFGERVSGFSEAYLGEIPTF